MMGRVKVYLVEEGLGYGERAVLSILSALGSRGRVYVIDGLERLAQDLNINKNSLLYYLRSLEKKGYLEVDRRKLPSRIFVADIKLNLKNGAWIEVPRSFLYAGSPKERGLLLTLASMAKAYKLFAGGGKVKRAAFYLREMAAPDLRSNVSIRKLIQSLQRKGFILIERTRPFYVVRVVL